MQCQREKQQQPGFAVATQYNSKLQVRHRPNPAALTVSKSSPSLSPNSTVTCTGPTDGQRNARQTVDGLLRHQPSTLVAKGSDMLSIFTIGTGPAWDLSAVAVAPLLVAQVLRERICFQSTETGLWLRCHSPVAHLKLCLTCLTATTGLKALHRATSTSVAALTFHRAGQVRNHRATDLALATL